MKNFNQQKEEILNRTKEPQGYQEPHNKVLECNTSDELIEVVKGVLKRQMWPHNKEILNTDLLLEVFGKKFLIQNHIYTLGKHDITFDDGLHHIYILGNSSVDIDAKGSSYINVLMGHTSLANIGGSEHSAIYIETYETAAVNVYTNHYSIANVMARENSTANLSLRGSISNVYTAHNSSAHVETSGSSIVNIEMDDNSSVNVQTSGHSSANVNSRSSSSGQVETSGHSSANIEIGRNADLTTRVIGKDSFIRIHNSNTIELSNDSSSLQLAN